MILIQERTKYLQGSSMCRLKNISFICRQFYYVQITRKIKYLILHLCYIIYE